ncbi:hypothetical protein [Bacillus badius]|uniref:Uncharacterized protein n=1 Tax=Bacillus badius TaxID=1455 RepID=A0ABR5AS76_BACBA|nr:hypothetical protein [Bacillus badius]KIL77206.1 hypothetical protein SD77_1653 [Bacillus badius]KZO01053.1 hypothetical protein A4244_13565 [Bacillus badius]MED0668008.1 hypothetical protein [Bacillus badius]MED4717570.1 hypothetical protein [Bacillus badius]OCS89105.1 hypothetical protein A6M11_13585 [Bacillus badius]
MDKQLSDILFVNYLQNTSAATFNSISLALAFVVFVVGLYCIEKKHKYGMYILASSSLLLINPAISIFL